MPKASVAYESRSGTRSRSAYRRKVRAALEALGHRHPEHEMQRSEAYIDRAEHAEIDPKTAAAIIDATLHHAHPHKVQMSEESPTRDEWEVLVRGVDPKTKDAIRSMYPHTRLVGSSSVVVEDLYDDEKAAKIARDITRKYGAVVTYGPRAKIAAECSAMEGGRGEGLDNYQDGRRKAKFTYDAHREEIGKVFKKKGRSPAIEAAAKFGGIDLSEDNAVTSGFIDEMYRLLAPRYEARDSGGPFTQIHRDPAKFAAVKERADAIGPLKDDRALYELLVVDLEKETQEVFYVVTVDVHGQLLQYAEVARGQTDRVAISAREIFPVVLLDKASGFAVAHNHPSGTARPSDADKELTKRVKDAAAVVCPEVAFLDHLVVTGSEYYSFTSKKLVKAKR